MNCKSLIEGISRDIQGTKGIKIADEDIILVARELLPLRECTIHEIIKNTGIWPVSNLISIILALEKRRFLRIERGNILTDLTKIDELKRVCKQMEFSAAKFICQACKGTRYSVNETLVQKLSEEGKRYRKNFPEAAPIFYQLHASLETSCRRIAMMIEKGDVQGKSVIFLGDDDLMSLLVGLSGLASKVTVIDIDRRITAFIKSVIRQRGLERIDVLNRDLRKPLPKSLLGNFDTFFTDPPYSEDETITFLSRGFEALKDRGTGYFCLDKVQKNVQCFILNHSFIITDLVRNFNNYGVSSFDRLWLKRTYKNKFRSTPTGVWALSSIMRIEREGSDGLLFPLQRKP